jgi:hypothetical protein
MSDLYIKNTGQYQINELQRQNYKLKEALEKTLGNLKSLYQFNETAVKYNLTLEKFQKNFESEIKLLNEIKFGK